MTSPRPPSSAPRVRFSAERVIPAPPDEIWALWTTPERLAEWWGPEDVVTTVETLDVRPGGAIELAFEYAATAADPARRAEFEAAGIPTSYRAVGTFREVEAPRHISFDQLVAFGGLPPVPYRFRAELRPVAGGVRVRLTAESEANPHWRTLGRANLTAQLDRLARLVAPSPPRGASTPVDRPPK